VAAFASDCARGARSRALLRDAALVLLLAGCGADAEQRYAGLSRLDVQVEGAGFRARYLSPPWHSKPDDPLVTGAREEVPVGEAAVAIVPDSALVLEIEHESSVPDPMGVGYPKYRLEGALLRCTEEQVEQAESCARAFAGQDLEGRSASEDTEFFGTEPHPGTNDFGQQFWELMTRVPETNRRRRIQYLQAEDALTTLRLFVEANPELDEPEMTRMLSSFELLPGSDPGEGR
jgi:hypothetical protein